MPEWRYLWRGAKVHRRLAFPNYSLFIQKKKDGTKPFFFTFFFTKTFISQSQHWKLARKTEPEFISPSRISPLSLLLNDVMVTVINSWPSLCHFLAFCCATSNSVVFQKGFMVGFILFSSIFCWYQFHLYPHPILCSLNSSSCSFDSTPWRLTKGQ